ncbi:MAG: GntR family transcriptional regulator [Pseudonocardiaceae bacterium]
MPVDHRNDRPIYAQIADELRSRIKSGEYGPGAKLPSEAELAGAHGVTRVTVRRALAVLAAEGRTESIKGRGVFVREVPPVMRMGNNRFSREARRRGLGAFAAEAERLGLASGQEDLEIVTVDSPLEVAEVLGEPRSVVKRRRMILAGVPTQLADSYVPLSIADKIGYGRGATAPGGTYGLLELHGHEITKFREQISIRSADPEEAIALELPLAAPVAVLVRIAYDQAGRAVEYFDSVAAGDKHIYVYEFDAPKD